MNWQITGRTDLHIIRNGVLTARRYADEIQRHLVMLFASVVGDTFVFQLHNVRLHTARPVENMFEGETMESMKWPACSPDLNPIEHV